MRVAALSRRSYGVSSAAWPERTNCGVSGGSKQNWRGSGSKSPPEHVANYMHRPKDRRPSPGWRPFLKQHASTIWACDFSCVQSIRFRTFYVFFVIHHASRQVLHVLVTLHPSAEWTAQQIVECCAWDRKPPSYLIHDRDSIYGTSFDRRVSKLARHSDRLAPTRSPSDG